MKTPYKCPCFFVFFPPNTVKAGHTHTDIDPMSRCAHVLTVGMLTCNAAVSGVTCDMSSLSSVGGAARVPSVYITAAHSTRRF